MNFRGYSLTGYSLMGWVILTSLGILAGCTHVDQYAFSQLNAGMSIEDVEGILGKPQSCRDQLGRMECVWKDKDREIRVSYVNQKVVVYGASGLQ